jgi:hypothetical protein
MQILVRHFVILTIDCDYWGVMWTTSVKTAWSVRILGLEYANVDKSCQMSSLKWMQYLCFIIFASFTGWSRVAYGFLFAELIASKVVKIGFSKVNYPAETKNEEFPTFFWLKVKYGMGIFPYETILRDIPFLKKVVGPKRRFDISAGSHESQRNDPAEIISALKLTQLRSFWWGQLPC